MKPLSAWYENEEAVKKYIAGIDNVLNLCYGMSNSQQDDEEAVMSTMDEDNLASSCKSFNRYGNTSMKILLPQIVASLITSAVMLGVGTCFAHSSVLIAQLSLNSSEIHPSRSENSLTASMAFLPMPVLSLISGVLMDTFGRLNMIKIGSIPAITGWITMLFAKNMMTIIIARFLIGASVGLVINPSLVYVTEISNPNIRMSLLFISEFYASLGTILTFAGGWILHWRNISWLGILFTALPTVLCFTIPESPAWLILKGKTKKAQKSLSWIYQNHGNKESFAELQFKLLQEERGRSKSDSGVEKDESLNIFKEFLKPTGYKPLIILIILFVFHHFSGVNMTTSYSISFLEETGTDINPYVTSILSGFVKTFMTIISIYILKNIKRRSLLIISGLGMAISMFVGGLFTMLIREGSTNQKWIPTITYLAYLIFSMLGFSTLPTRFLSEFLPLKIRGIGYSIGACIYCSMLLLSIQSYYFLLEHLGGNDKLQWFFGMMSLTGVVYGYIFIPETKGVELIEISNYFKNRWIYPRHKKDQNLRVIN